MTVSAITTGSLSQAVLSSSSLSTSQQAWQKLQQSLASGNLSAAQSAFNTYQQIDSTLTAMNGGTSTDSSQVTSDMSALGTALSSGDLTGAQQAFATLQTDMNGAPSQSLTAAMTAMNQTVQMVSDLVSFSSSSSSSSSGDPGTQAIDASYGGSSATTNEVDLAQAALDKAQQSGDAISSNTGSTPSPVDLSTNVNSSDNLDGIDDYA